jgi:diadenosine tetraphosphate (Ap4A) HIT family hydrolase
MRQSAWDSNRIGAPIIGPTATCPLCDDTAGEPIWQDALCRVVRVDEPGSESFAGFCRVIWRRHVAEMSDLTAPERRHLMSVVFACEAALRQLARPDKINLASLGNVVPHLHWHVIPRWRDDSHFPAPIWAAAQRAALPRPRPTTRQLHDALVAALAEEHGGGIV